MVLLSVTATSKQMGGGVSYSTIVTTYAYAYPYAYGTLSRRLKKNRCFYLRYMFTVQNLIQKSLSCACKHIGMVSVYQIINRVVILVCDSTKTPVPTRMCGVCTACAQVYGSVSRLMALPLMMIPFLSLLANLSPLTRCCALMACQVDMQFWFYPSQTI
jgi:hypothetical protein